MRIVFMGTPDFAVPSLEALLSRGDTVVGVFTQPDKPKGRGKKLTSSPVKVTAQAHGIPVFQPRRIRKDGVEDLREKVGYYLEHEEERRAIAESGYRKVKETHLYIERIRTMLAQVAEAERGRAVSFAAIRC